MSTADADRLRSIKTFPSLVKYLRDELDWPIASEDFDDLTFDYEAEELGLDSKSAVKVKEIKQLRPLTSSQPWGIFFVNFEPKRLPVVVLRRILRALVIKKRQSANKPQQAAWQRHDLLFISAYGEADHRDITFANFEDEDNGDLPTLRVLGWDDEDTVLHLAHAHEVLREKLRWPRNSTDIEAWRRTWSAAFTLKYRQVITTSRDLAVRMAELATAIRKRVNRVLAVESENGALRKLMTAFREALIHDLSADDFADMYAQTITYGLLSARVSRPMGLVAENLKDMVPVTNPFLQDLLSQFLTVGGRKGRIDFDELGINEVVQALRDADMEAVLRDFGDRNPQEDPVVHFYELFLKEYDPRKRMQRGVFYTPRPVVSFIVRSVHELLQKDFGIEDGLASTVTWAGVAARHSGLTIPTGTKPSDPFVVVLDPAVGTATFLVEVIDVIHSTLVAKWKNQGLDDVQRRAAWNAYVPKHLLPRIHGYELMMAPYAIAHMKIGLKLHETDYRFGSAERVRVYLTNSLEPPSDDKKQREFEEWAPMIAHEAQAVNTIKMHQHFTVVIGNPPYSYMSANLTRAAAALIEPFRFVDGERIRERSALSLERSLQDDFVKFLGLAVSLRRNTGAAFVLGFITNNSYMDSTLHRGVRGELMRVFSRLYLVNLFGDSIKDGEENVFDIQQGVAICLGAARGEDTTVCVYVSDVHGSRDGKYATLTQRNFRTSDFVEIQPSPPQRYFLRLEKGEEYFGLPSLTDMFQVTSTCIKTLKDDLATGFDSREVQEKIEYFRDPSASRADVKERFGVEDVVQWTVEPARRAIRGIRVEDFITEYQARPFDYRWMFYHNAIVGSPRTEVMRNLLRTSNRALIANRKIRTGQCRHFWVTSRICVSEIISSADNSNCFPLYVVADEQGFNLGAQRHPNFRTAFSSRLSSALRLPQMADSGLPEGHTAEDVFHYA